MSIFSNQKMQKIDALAARTNSMAVRLTLLVALFVSTSASALQLDWNGQFWFDHNWLYDYQLDRSRPGSDADAALSSAGGAYVPGAGEKSAIWMSAFLRLQPKVIVNDSINVQSELHIGSPIFNFFGRNFPTTQDRRYDFTGYYADGLTVSAQRMWANLITDFGTIEVGRAPINWGLGAIWDGGNYLFDRYQSTGDMVRLVSKFGNFSIAPAVIKLVSGNNLGGASNAAGSIISGSDDITDYTIAAQYDNPEEDFDFGVRYARRTGSTAQRSLYFNPSLTGSTRIQLNMFDFYARKKLGRFTLNGEIPLFDGNLGSLDGANEFEYKAIAEIFEGAYTSELWNIGLKIGHVPGQPASDVGDRKFRAIFLHQNYDLGLLMFHYNIYGLNNNNSDSVPTGATLNSPYDSPVTNATYFGFFPEYKVDRWAFKFASIVAWANERAKAGKRIYNHQKRQFFTAVADQSSFLGKEFNLGASFKWDENFIISWDVGLWFPGDFYSFTNLVGAKAIDLSSLFGSQIKAGITF